MNLSELYDNLPIYLFISWLFGSLLGAAYDGRLTYHDAFLAGALFVGILALWLAMVSGRELWEMFFK